ncbi:hypothetical protein B0T11DRAFT_142840 [Plectosphaerella cucumerina]|uniref:Peptidase metallopeptidase domain-containing protein n=1 Tax=Plectosphaerella cucumerina TaxID=40658 RepID=A0A8K0TAE7_9PEZI|nr:hypothetical protein B0T11DRAFT_142840 [Plectosphaerella cucumerina]
MSEPVQICALRRVPEEFAEAAIALALSERPSNAAGPGNGEDRLAFPLKRMWKSGRELRVRFLDGSPLIQEKIRNYANQWQRYANIRFTWVDGGDTDIRISVGDGGGSWSYLGTDNGGIPQDQKTMNFGWLNDDSAEHEISRVVLHEFGHALGCHHEHQSPAAGIPWNEAAVLEYYKRTNGWDDATIRRSLLEKYPADETQFSFFDTSSIMIYAFPAELTLDGSSVPWNTVLSDNDKTFMSRTYPLEGSMLDTFYTMEIQDGPLTCTELTKRANYAGVFRESPVVAVGLNYIDVDRQANLRVQAIADQINTSKAEIHLSQWSDTKAYGLGCAWGTFAADDPVIQVGEFALSEDHPWNEPRPRTVRRVNFKRPFANGAPRVVVWYKMLDMDSGKWWRAMAAAENVSAEGFDLVVETWGDSVLFGGAVTWLAHQENRAGLVSGTFSTADVRNERLPQLETYGHVDLPAGTFDSPPKVLVAFRRISVENSANLRIKVGVSNVSASGFDWHINGWADSNIFSGVADFVCFA